MTSALASRQKKPGKSGGAPAASQPDVASAASGELPALAAPPDRELLEGPSREDLIRRRAFDLYERNGAVDGRALDDWLAAEAELGQAMLEGTAPAESFTKD